MTAAGEILTQAFSHHRAGDLQRAAQLYRQVLDADPRHADALHLLGVVAYQAGRPDEALSLLKRAVAANPTNAAYHSNTGLALQALGRLAEAADHYRRALALRPDYAAAVGNLGTVLRLQGNLQEAEASFREAVRLAGNQAGAHANLGDVLLAQGRFHEAVAALRQAIAFDPRHAAARFGLGEALRRLGHFAEAEACSRELIRVQPNFAGAYNSLATCLREQRRWPEAAAAYGEALRLNPQFAEAHNNLGCVFHDLGELDQAVASFHEALRLSPTFAPASKNLGLALRDLGRLDEALVQYDRAVELSPHDGEAHAGRAAIWLLRGDFARGWAEYERRRASHPFTQPCWDGSPLSGKTVLLYADEGLGDTLQFVRYAKLVARRGGRIILECQEVLHPLLSRCEGIHRLVAPAGELHAFDFHAPLLSLPLVFGTTLETVPADIPYLFADEALVARWRDRLAGVSGFRIAINWCGRATNPVERFRSIPLAHFAAVAAVEDVRLISVQKGAAAEELGSVADHWPVTHLGGELDETGGAFTDTAAVLKNVDLVITSDTAVAHLAGGLGVPVWVGLWATPEWRWLLDREDSPWYPTMRLFRQRQPGDWAEVMGRMAAELARLAGSPRKEIPHASL